MDNSFMYQHLSDIEEPDDSDFYLPDYDNQEEDDSNFIYIINTILSGTARLNVLLPTATILAFTIFAPILTNDGQCNKFEQWMTGIFLVLSAASCVFFKFEQWMTGIFLVLSAASCVFFSFTDSFKSATGRLHYGVATFSGIWTFNGRRTKPCVPRDYRLRWSDIFHASLSLVAFLTFAASHNDVLQCYHFAVPRKVINTVPLVIGFVISLLFVIFPSRRRGIGYPFLLQSDV